MATASTAAILPSLAPTIDNCESVAIGSDGPAHAQPESEPLSSQDHARMYPQSLWHLLSSALEDRAAKAAAAAGRRPPWQFVYTVTVTVPGPSSQLAAGSVCSSSPAASAADAGSSSCSPCFSLAWAAQASDPSQASLGSELPDSHCQWTDTQAVGQSSRCSSQDPGLGPVARLWAVTVARAHSGLGAVCDTVTDH